MKRSFVLLLLTAALAACATHPAAPRHSSASSSQDYVKPGAIQIPGYSTDSSK